jgi:hypothetical protein
LPYRSLGDGDTDLYDGPDQPPGRSHAMIEIEAIAVIDD